MPRSSERVVSWLTTDGLRGAFARDVDAPKPYIIAAI
jgi:hypothetical protein